MSLDHNRNEPDVSLDIPEVSKHNWKSLEIRDTWSEPLNSFVDNRRNVAQVALQDNDHPRRMLRRIVPAERKSEVLEELPEWIDVAYEEDEQVATFVLTSPECPTSPEKLLNRETGLSEELRLQGAPECCATAYVEHREDGHADPIAAIAKETPSTVETDGELVVQNPYPVLNPMWAFQGWSFIDFYPCSFECDHAQQTAIQTGELFREIQEDRAAEAAYEFLAEPVYWSAYHGLAHVKGSWCIGEYTTDDYWHEQVVRFNGYHEDTGDPATVNFE